MSLILTGNPGVGKHTIGKQLAARLDLDLVDLNEIALQKGIFEEFEGILEVDVQKLKRILKKVITKKSLVVGHLAPYVVSRKQANIVVVLRRNPYELISVYKKRKYLNQKAKDNLGSEILGLIYYDSKKEFGSKKTFQLDTTSKSVNSIIELITELFVKGVFQEDEVDWLDLILKKNDFSHFFPY